MPMLSETIDRLWMRCGPVLTFVVPDYVARKRGAAHHAHLVAPLVAAAGNRATPALRAAIGEAVASPLSLAHRAVLIRPPRDTSAGRRIGQSGFRPFSFRVVASNYKTK